MFSLGHCPNSNSYRMGWTSLIPSIQRAPTVLLTTLLGIHRPCTFQFILCCKMGASCRRNEWLPRFTISDLEKLFQLGFKLRFSTKLGFKLRFSTSMVSNRARHLRSEIRPTRQVTSVLKNLHTSTDIVQSIYVCKKKMCFWGVVDHFPGRGGSTRLKLTFYS